MNPGRPVRATVPMTIRLGIALHADGLSVLFVTLSTILGLVTTVCAIGYLKTSPHNSRFYG